MADYYSLLARAVANLPKSSPPSTRRAIYERARKALTNQLRSLKPQLPESDIAREERALDDAVARLEAEFEPPGGEIHTLPSAAAGAAVAELVEAPPPPAPPPPPLAAPAPPPFPPAPRVAEPQVAPAVARMAPPRPAPAAPLKPPTPPRAPLPPPAAKPSLPPAVGLPNAGAFKPPSLGSAAPMYEPSADAFQPQLGPARPEDLPAEDDDTAPSLGSAGGRYERAATRPTLADGRRRKTPPWLWVAGAVAVGFAGSIAVAAFLMRPALRDLAPAPPVEQPTTAPSGESKQTIRVPSTVAETPPPAPAASGTPSDSASAEPSPTPSAPPSVAAQPSESPTPTALASPEATPNAAPTVPIASRAAMLVATVADAAKPAINVGTAVWTTLPAPQGQPNGIGVKAEIEIPDLKLHASMILRKNFDSSLPASHTIDLRLSFDAGSPVKGIKDIALPLMRRDDPPAADALAGVRVKISDNYYLIGLNRGDTDVIRNVQEIAERGWFDFPMQLDDDRIAKLTFEKGADGEKLIAQALAAWK